jgi:hypothetical protein
MHKNKSKPELRKFISIPPYRRFKAKWRKVTENICKLPFKGKFYNSALEKTLLPFSIVGQKM